MRCWQVPEECIDGEKELKPTMKIAKGRMRVLSI